MKKRKTNLTTRKYRNNGGRSREFKKRKMEEERGEETKESQKLSPTFEPAATHLKPPQRKRKKSEKQRRADQMRENRQDRSPREKKSQDSQYFASEVLPERLRSQTRPTQSQMKTCQNPKEGERLFRSIAERNRMLDQLIQTDDWRKYTEERQLRLSRIGENPSSFFNQEEAEELDILIKLHPDRARCLIFHRLREGNESFEIFSDILDEMERDLLEADKGRAVGQNDGRSEEAAYLELYEKLEGGKRKEWDRTIKPILKQLLPPSTEVPSSKKLQDSQTVQVQELMDQMGLCYARKGGQAVVWFEPSVFLEWLFSQAVIQKWVQLPKNFVIGVENIDAYSQFRFTDQGKEYVQYQLNLISNLYLPQSLLLLIPFARVRAKDSHQEVSSLLSHVIEKVRAVEKSGFPGLNGQRYSLITLGAHDGNFRRIGLGVSSACSSWPVGIAPIHKKQLGSFYLDVSPLTTKKQANDLAKLWEEKNIPEMKKSKYNEDNRRKMAREFYYGYFFKQNLIDKDASEDISGIGHLFNRASHTLWVRLFEFALLIDKGTQLFNALSISISSTDNLSSQISMNGPRYRLWLKKRLSSVKNAFGISCENQGSSLVVGEILDSFFSSAQELLFLLEESKSVTTSACFFVGRKFGAFFVFMFGDQVSTPSIFELTCCLDIHFQRILAVCDLAGFNDSPISKAIFPWLEWPHEGGHVRSKENFKNTNFQNPRPSSGCGESSCFENVGGKRLERDSSVAKSSLVKSMENFGVAFKKVFDEKFEEKCLARQKKEEKKNQEKRGNENEEEKEEKEIEEVDDDDQMMRDENRNCIWLEEKNKLLQQINKFIQQDGTVEVVTEESAKKFLSTIPQNDSRLLAKIYFGDSLVVNFEQIISPGAFPVSTVVAHSSSGSSSASMGLTSFVSSCVPSSSPRNNLDISSLSSGQLSDWSSQITTRMQNEGHTGFFGVDQEKETSAVIQTNEGSSLTLTETCRTRICVNIDVPDRYNKGEFRTNFASQRFFLLFESETDNPKSVFRVVIPFSMIQSLQLTDDDWALLIQLKELPIFEWKERRRETKWQVQSKFFSPHGQKQLEKKQTIKVSLKKQKNLHKVYDRFSKEKLMSLSPSIQKLFDESSPSNVRNPIVIATREFDFPLYWDPNLVRAMLEILIDKELELQQQQQQGDDDPLEFDTRRKKFLVFLKAAHKAFFSLYDSRKTTQKPLKF